MKRDLFNFIKFSKDKFLQMEKDRLFNESKDIFGDALGFYSYATEIITKGAKKKGEPFDAYESGDLFKLMYMQETSGVLRFGSTSPHWAEILKSKSWLSHELFGLSDQQLNKMIETELLPFVQQNTREILGY